MAQEQASSARDSGKGFLQRFFGRMRSPQLVVVLALLFLVDLAVPDMIPFVDEVVLGLLTLLAARWRDRRPEPQAAKPPPKNVTPR